MIISKGGLASGRRLESIGLSCAQSLVGWFVPGVGPESAGLSQLAYWLLLAGGDQLALTVGFQAARFESGSLRVLPNAIGTRATQSWDLEGRMQGSLKFKPKHQL